jgi:hypothetical protein
MQEKEYAQVYEMGLGSLIGDFFQNVKDTVSGVAKAVAPIAPYVLPFIPGIGPIAKLGIGAGINLAAGQKPADVAKNLALQAALTGITGGFKGTATKAPIATGAPTVSADQAYRNELLSFFDEKVPGIVKTPGIESITQDPTFFEKLGGTTKDFFTDGYGARLNPFSQASKFKLNSAYAGMDQALIDKIIKNPFAPEYSSFVSKFGMPMLERGIAGQIGPLVAAGSAFAPFVLPQPKVDDTDYVQQARDDFQIRYSADGGPVTGFAAGSGQKIEHPDGKVKEHPKRIGEIAGAGTGTSDDIPAMLSDGEFVMTAQAVRNAGGGSRKAGAKNMYKLMKSLEKGGSLSEQSMGMVGRA